VLGAGFAPLAMDITLQGTQVCSASVAVPYEEAALTKELADGEIDYEVTLGGGDAIHAETEIFFSDLSHEYVTINADYTT
jgi:glutamate N-acetyltransferase/amino-acid N-acetyltransferase